MPCDYETTKLDTRQVWLFRTSTCSFDACPSTPAPFDAAAPRLTDSSAHPRRTRSVTAGADPGESNIGKVLEESAQADLPPSERANAAPRQKCLPGEGQMFVGVGPAHVEAVVRIGEHRGIPVRGGEIDDDQLATPDRYTCDFGVDSGDTRGQLDRRLHAKDLLDRVGPERRILPKDVQLVRFVQQQANSIAQQIDSRFEARRQNQPGRRPKFVIVEMRPSSDTWIN